MKLVVIYIILDIHDNLVSITLLLVSMLVNSTPRCFETPAVLTQSYLHADDAGSIKIQVHLCNITCQDHIQPECEGISIFTVTASQC
jgi:hypothetical protein